MTFYKTSPTLLNMTKTFTFYTDPGHGWLAVTYADVLAAGLDLKDFSCYSYVRGQTLFLEEDQDAGVFLEAWKKLGMSFKIEDNYSDNDSFVRRLARIR